MIFFTYCACKFYFNVSKDIKHTIVIIIYILRYIQLKNITFIQYNLYYFKKYSLLNDNTFYIFNIIKGKKIYIHYNYITFKKYSLTTYITLNYNIYIIKTFFIIYLIIEYP